LDSFLFTLLLARFRTAIRTILLRLHFWLHFSKIGNILENYNENFACNY